LDYDIVIRGGTVLDGTGADGFLADVGIVNDRISAVGDLSRAEAGRVIDATNRRVTPGFIDIHTHSDISATFHPGQESIISQGVTTQVVGNCSLCIGLATDEDIFAFEKRWLGAHGARITWNTFDGHLRRVEEIGVSTNYVMLAGQGTLRKRVVGMEARPATADEMDRMKAVLEEAFEAGAWGLSTGLEYTPSKYAGIPELAEISQVAGKYGGFYASHLRNEGDYLIEAVSEAIEIGERAGVPVQLSHHKAEGRQNWGKVRTTLKMVEEVRARGLDVQLDQYPYPAFQTSMSVQFLPDWANLGDNDTVLGRLRDPDQRAAILADIRTNHADWDDLGPDSPWERVEIGVCRTNRSLQGHTIAELARSRGKNPLEMILDIILEERNLISAINFAIDEDDIAYVMRHRLTMIGSDAVGTAPRGTMAEDRVHPRSYGTFPRVLGRYVREQQVLSEADAVRKMTSMPADRIGLRDRGRIAVGGYADVVVYDPATVTDNATFADSHQFSSGIELVLVNGRVVWEADAATSNLPGRVLRRTNSSDSRPIS
jgi:N-acyl-D-amino-acid deacylase